MFSEYSSSDFVSIVLMSSDFNLLMFKTLLLCSGKPEHLSTRLLMLYHAHLLASSGDPVSRDTDRHLTKFHHINSSWNFWHVRKRVISIPSSIFVNSNLPFGYLQNISRYYSNEPCTYIRLNSRISHDKRHEQHYKNIRYVQKSWRRIHLYCNPVTYSADLSLIK